MAGETFRLSLCKNKICMATFAINQVMLANKSKAGCFVVKFSFSKINFPVC